MIPLTLFGLVLGAGLAALFTLLFGVYSIGPTERGVLTTFGRVQRTPGTTAEDPQLGALLTDDEKLRYNYPNVRVIPQGGPYFKWPWQKLYKVDMTIQAIDITWDPDIKQDTIEAVTKDNLTVQISGQIRWKPCERNLYAYLSVSRILRHTWLAISSPFCATVSPHSTARRTKVQSRVSRSMTSAEIFP